MGKQLKAIRNPNTVKFTPTPRVGAAPPMVAAPSSPAVRATYPGATAATPAGPPPAGAQAQPFDPTFEAQVGLNTRNFNDANVGFDQQEAATKAAYGLDDPNNPFSRAQLLREAYHNRSRGSGNSMAAQGQLYSGAYQNAQNAATHSFDIGFDQLRGEQNAVLAGIASRRAAARSGFDQGNIDAGSAALSRATATEPDPATLPPPPAKKKIKVKAKGTKYTGMR